MFRQFIIRFLLLLWVSVAYGASVEQARFNQLFTHSAKPPPGFEALAEKQTLFVDVYYLGRLIAVTKVSVSSNRIQFLQAKEILDKVGPLKDSEKVVSKLQQPMHTNSHMVCGAEPTGQCNQLSPELVEVIYEPDLFRILLFINPDFLVEEQNTQWLEPSTAGLSYLNNVFVAADSGNHNYPFANYLDSITNVPLYNVTSDNIFAYQNTRINISGSYANRANFANVLDQDRLQLNVANIAHTHQQYEYRAGVIEFPSTIFFASNAVLGAEVRTTLNTKEYFVATPLTVFLPIPATVSLIRGSSIIYSAKLPAGNQKIDTSNFPQGSYPVTVRINDVQGGTSIMTKMVTNSPLLAPKGMPQSYFSMGYLMGIRQLNSNVYDNLLPIPVYQAGTNYRMSANTGIMMKVLGSDKAAFFNPGLTFLGHHFIIQPGVLFSTNQRYGYTANATWQKNHWTASYTMSEILSPNTPWIDNYCFKDDPTSCALNLLNQGNYFTSFSLGYGFSSGNISLYYSENNYYNLQKLYTYGVNFLTAIHQTPSGSWQLNLNASRNQAETSIFATITYQFSDAHKSGNVGMGYGHFRNNYYSDSNLDTANGNGLTTQGNVIWHKTDDTNYGYTVGLQGNTDPINKTFGATYDLSKPTFHTNAYVTNYTDNLGNYSQYGGVFYTRYAWAQHKSAVGNGLLDENTGIIVRINAQDPRATFDVYAEDKLVLHLHANKNYLIKLQAYKTWHISISDTSRHLYHLPKKERVITLYPGNVQTLTWNASRMIALGGRILNQQNAPMSHAKLKGVIGFAMTDEQGYFQANVAGNVQQLSVISASEQCMVAIPSIDTSKNSSYLGTLNCDSQQTTRH